MILIGLKMYFKQFFFWGGEISQIILGFDPSNLVQQIKSYQLWNLIICEILKWTYKRRLVNKCKKKKKKKKKQIQKLQLSEPIFAQELTLF